MNLRVLVVDDEPLARERLSHLVEELPEVVLLDIRMPGMDGLEVAHHLARMPEPPAVIFTTAFEQHALAAFDAQAAGYLLKPVRPERLREALERARRPTRAQLARIAEGTGGPRTRIAVRVREELRLIPVDSIICFVAEQKYTTLRHASGEELIEESLKSLEEEFAGRFIRVHRNSLVALSHVDGLERGADGQQLVRLRGGATLAVSRRLATDVARALSGRMGG